MADDAREIEKYLVQQEGVSNKFWQVCTDGARQTVRYGRVGTDGRETVKDFDDADTCRRETEKLVAAKMRKGYLEVADESEVPEKDEPSDDERAELMFWEAIEASNKWKKVRRDEYDADEHVENLTALLAKKGKGTLVQFQRQMVLNLNALYTGAVADLYMILANDYSSDGDAVTFTRFISDDDFLYFRCWLLLKGRQLVEAVRNDITTCLGGGFNLNRDECWPDGEGLLYVADRAFAEKNGTDPDDAYEIIDALRELDPDLDYDSPPDMDRDPTYDLQAAYPRLVATIVALR